jgi:dTMP kinase
MPGRFFVFDGIDGCGKSTQMVRAAQRLTSEGYDVISTREPGGTPIAEKIRSIILSPENQEMAPECELLLYGAARGQHVREKIEPALNKGTIVLCDRFELATFAYQGSGRSIPLELLKRINAIATGKYSPDLTFIFDIPVATAFGRLLAMNKAHDRLEQEDGSFFTRVADGYRTLAAEDPAHIVLLDAEQSVEELADIVYRHMIPLIKTEPQGSGFRRQKPNSLQSNSL